MAYNTYYPNESIRFYATINVLGAPTDPLTLTLHLEDAAGAVTTYPSPTPSAVGSWYQDVSVPASPAAGVWSYYWTCAGSNTNQNGASKPQSFMVAFEGF